MQAAYDFLFTVSQLGKRWKQHSVHSVNHIKGFRSVAQFFNDLCVYLQLWEEDGLDLALIPYGCVATGPDSGFIEVIKNARTIAEVCYFPQLAFHPLVFLKLFG